VHTRAYLVARRDDGAAVDELGLLARLGMSLALEEKTQQRATYKAPRRRTRARTAPRRSGHRCGFRE
jgi:hypothetical protein